MVKKGSKKHIALWRKVIVVTLVVIVGVLACVVVWMLLPQPDKSQDILNAAKDEITSYRECRSKSYDSDSKEVPPYVCVDHNNGKKYYAGGEGRSVNDFEACKKAGGPMRKQGIPDTCYYDGVVYYQVVKGNHYLNPPYELKTFSDCVLPGIAIDVSYTDGKAICTAFNRKEYFYNGPPIKTYDDCVKVMRISLDSNPPQCYGPDGKHYVGLRS